MTPSLSARRRGDTNHAVDVTARGEKRFLQDVRRGIPIPSGFEKKREGVSCRLITNTDEHTLKKYQSQPHKVFTRKDAHVQLSGGKQSWFNSHQRLSDISRCQLAAVEFVHLQQCQLVYNLVADKVVD